MFLSMFPMFLPRITAAPRTCPRPRRWRQQRPGRRTAPGTRMRWDMGGSINGGSPKWMVYKIYKGQSYEHGWFSGTPILGTLHIWIILMRKEHTGNILIKWDVWMILMIILIFDMRHLIKWDIWSNETFDNEHLWTHDSYIHIYIYCHVEYMWIWIRHISYQYPVEIFLSSG